MCIEAEELQEKYPERKIVVIDTLCASLGEGLIDYKALELQKEGKSLEEVAQWVEENKLKICHFFMVEDLNHLQKGGRISKTAAVLGTMVQIKPIIYLDNEGKLQIIKKERGRKKAMKDRGYGNRCMRRKDAGHGDDSARQLSEGCRVCSGAGA